MPWAARVRTPPRAPPPFCPSRSLGTNPRLTDMDTDTAWACVKQGGPQARSWQNPAGLSTRAGDPLLGLRSPSPKPSTDVPPRGQPSLRAGCTPQASRGLEDLLRLKGKGLPGATCEAQARLGLSRKPGPGPGLDRTSWFLPCQKTRGAGRARRAALPGMWEGWAPPLQASRHPARRHARVGGAVFTWKQVMRGLLAGPDPTGPAGPVMGAAVGAPAADPGAADGLRVKAPGGRCRLGPMTWASDSLLSLAFCICDTGTTRAPETQREPACLEAQGRQIRGAGRCLWGSGKGVPEEGCLPGPVYWPLGHVG